ncbi:hypothetical protein [Micromonospora pisi]|nr:hypothetical protein [Micromonospora pisi]
MSRRIMSGAAMLALATGTLVTGGTSPAMAGTLPSCVNLGWAPGVDSVSVDNTCGYDVNAKVLVNNWSDSDCHTVKAHTTWRYEWYFLGDFDGVVTC